LSDPSDIDVVLGEARPQAESAALVLARAKVAAALFGAKADQNILGRFAVLDRLGTGGMGVVYAAYDTELDRRVALKMITLAEGDRAAALAEAKALAKLSHPNVVPVYDVGSVDGRVYIVMELVRGATLGVWANARPLREVVAMYRQAAQGLAAAHAAGLVHRDFKPANAIVGEDGRLRVVDFGLATVDGGGRGGAGTAGYMAPEQATGSVTAAADQYSFAVTLGEAIPAPRPGWIEAVVARGSQRDPALRFASMSDLVRALDRDPRRVWPRRIAVAAIAGLAVTVGVLSLRSTDAVAGPALCAGATDRIAASWPARPAALTKLSAASAYGCCTRTIT
jgi:predicted Ser/Thr protein kinase